MESFGSPKTRGSGSMTGNVRKACDFCRWRRIKCNPEPNSLICKQCQHRRIRCTVGEKEDFKESFGRRKLSKGAGGFEADTSDEPSRSPGAPETQTEVPIDSVAAQRAPTVAPASQQGTAPITNTEIYERHVRINAPFFGDSQIDDVHDSFFDLCFNLCNPTTSLFVRQVLQTLFIQEATKVDFNFHTALAALIVIFKGSVPEAATHVITGCMNLAQRIQGTTAGDHLLACTIITDAWNSLHMGKQPSVPLVHSVQLSDDFGSRLQYLYAHSDLLRRLLSFNNYTPVFEKLQWEYELLELPLKLPHDLLYASHTLSSESAVFHNLCFSVLFQMYYSRNCFLAPLGLKPMDGLLLICAQSLEGIVLAVCQRMPELSSWIVGRKALQVGVESMINYWQQYKSQDALGALDLFLSVAEQSSWAPDDPELAALRTRAQALSPIAHRKDVNPHQSYWIFRDVRSMSILPFLSTTSP